MSTWFQIKVKYVKMDHQTGRQKRVTEPYLVDAVSFTDAETRLNECLEPYISGEFLLNDIKIARFSDIIPNENCDRWFKCKVSYISIDEERGTERKTSAFMLVEADNIKMAFDFVENAMEGSISDYEINSINESPIMDVFPYVKEKEEEFEETDDN